MYPPSNNNCNYSPNLSSLFHIPSPSMQFEHELLFQGFLDHYLQQQQQVPLIEDSSLHILADNTETVSNPSNSTDSVKILYSTEIVTSNQDPEGHEGVEGRENKEDDMMSSRNSIIGGRLLKYKRSSNKDRHSKINTARGPRDRRMRLSLDAARKFFGLQDLLGFDKASKTVEWLLIKSESAIEELAKGYGGAFPKQSCSTTGIGAICASNSISECEVISGIDETSSKNKKKETAEGGPPSNKKKKKKANTARRDAFEPLTRESRNQARARARERTKIRKISLIGKSNSGFWRHTNKACEEQLGTHQVEEVTFHQEDDCNLVVNENWNPFSIFNYQQNAGISHEVGPSDFVYLGFNN